MVRRKNPAQVQKHTRQHEHPHVLDASARLAQFRERKDQYFAQGAHSPLDAATRRHFTGLRYFPENPALALERRLDETGPGIGERIAVATSTGQPSDFVRAGRVTFDVAGTPVTLSLFRDVDRGRYFLPFRDATAGQETYEVGRYLDPQARPDGTLTIDFNYAYNPYCAYGEGWSCPIPPAENVVPVRIEAGEQAYPFPSAPSHAEGAGEESGDQR